MAETAGPGTYDFARRSPHPSTRVSEAKRLKALERENAELKKMLADSLPRNCVLGALNAK